MSRKVSEHHHHILGPFFLVNCIDATPTTETYLACYIDPTSIAEDNPRWVSLKRIKNAQQSNPSSENELILEAQIGQSLNHSNLLHVAELKKIENETLLISEWKDGVRLHRFLKTMKTKDALCPPDIALYIFSQVIEGWNFGFAKKTPMSSATSEDVHLSFDGHIRTSQIGDVRSAGKLLYELFTLEPYHPNVRIQSPVFSDFPSLPTLIQLALTESITLTKILNQIEELLLPQPGELLIELLLELFDSERIALEQMKTDGLFVLTERLNSQVEIEFNNTSSSGSLGKIKLSKRQVPKKK